MSTWIIHQKPPSPNCEKLRRVCARLGFPFDTQDYLPISPEAIQELEDFAARCGHNTVPVLERDGEFLADSNVITQILVEENPDKAHLLYPEDPQQQMMVQLFEISAEHWWLRPEAQYLTDAYKAEKGEAFVGNVLEQSYQRRDIALGRLERLLDGREWLVGDDYSKADIAVVSQMNARIFLPQLFASLGEAAPFSLDLWPSWDLDEATYPNITAWRERCNQPEYMQSPVAAA